MSEWIGVNEWLPESGCTIIVFDGMMRKIDVIPFDGELDPDYTHWMPLPDAPI